MLSCVKAKICRFRCLVPLTHSPTLAQLTVIQQQEDSSIPMRLRLITQALQEDASTAQVSIPPASPSSFSLTVGSYSLEFVKKSVFFKATTSALQVNFFSLLKSYSISHVCLQCTMEKALFLHLFLRSLLITRLSEGDALKMWWWWRENNRDVVVVEKNS